MSELEPQLSGTAPTPPAPSVADTAAPERIEETGVNVEPKELGDAPLEGLDVEHAGDVTLGGDRDPLVDREQGADEVRDAGGVGAKLAGHEPQFTSGEKVASLVDRLMNGPPPDDAKTRVALRALKWAKRVGMVDPIVALFPPIADAEAWDTWLALGIGIALNLVSDGVGVDQEQARVAGAEVLQAFFYGGDE